MLGLGAPIAPFGDAPAESPVLNRKLSDLQRETLAACGITEVSALSGGAAAALPRAAEPYLVLSDDLFVSRTLLREFVAAATAPGARGVMQLALPECRLLKDTAPLQDLRRGEHGGKPFTGFPAFVVHPDAPATLDEGGATPVVIDPREELRAIENVPRVFADE
ncbi:MAG TPA: hypothetical protein VMV18_12725, partial [bacterium]|nr:hypothetical protein [bacterium]